MSYNNYLQQLSRFLEPEQMHRLKQSTFMLSSRSQEKIFIWLLFEQKFLIQPHIDDKMDRFLYKIVKNEIFQ